MSERIISIEGTGIAKSEYQTATFRATVHEVAETGPGAKEKTRKVQKELFGALNQLREEGIEFRDQELRTSFEVTPYRVYDNTSQTNAFKGYQAVFTVTVTTDKIEDVGRIHDALTSINGVEAASPTLNLDPARRNKLKEEAFSAAVGVAQERFKSQCKALNVVYDNFEMINWRDGDHHAVGFAGGGKFAALTKCADDANDGPLEFHAGLATVTVNATLFYVRRPLS